MKKLHATILLFLLITLGLAAAWPAGLLVGKWVPEENKGSDYLFLGKDGTFFALYKDLGELDTITGTYYVQNDTLVMFAKLPDEEFPDEVMSRIVWLDSQRLGLINDDDDTFFLSRGK